MNGKTALIILLLLALAIALSNAASKFTVSPFDLLSYHELQEEASPPFNLLMQTVNYLGETAIALALTIIAVSTFAFALIVLIGPSRVFLGAHWASDVIGGYLIGTIWLIHLIIVYRRALQSVSERL